MLTGTLAALSSTFLISFAVAVAVNVAVPSAPSSTDVVQQNFLGISFELSFIDEYFGNDTSSIPDNIVNYLSTLRAVTGNNPVRIRVGGNSMDSSVFVPTQTSPMVQAFGPKVYANDQPVNFGPQLFQVLAKVASDVGGASYLIGLSLLDANNPNVPLVAGAAASTLGDTLDGFLLGNEPDLYKDHGFRSNISNYTTALYLNDFRTASNHLTTTSAGNILDKRDLGGPTICCNWSLASLLNDGYTAAFSNILKYISLQHYPQNNCNAGNYAYGIPYYLQHASTVTLGSWQNDGINMVLSNNGPNKKELILSEFNSASCGGIPTVSDTFAVGSLWTIDYALQLASVGYSAAYMHTRERGISYNLFTPNGPDGAPGPWTTNPPFYSLLVTAEALQSKNGSIVVDLNVAGSKQDVNANVSGYAVYDAVDKIVQQLVFFNFANATASQNISTTFVIPSNVFSSGTSLTVKYLHADNLKEVTNIGWGGQTLANVGNGKLVSSNAPWAPANSQMNCADGCSIQVPAPGMAVVLARPVSTNQSGNASLAPSAAGSSRKTTPSTTSSPSKGSSASRHTHSCSVLFMLLIAFFVALI